MAFTKEEITKMKKAGEIHKKVMDFVREIVKPGERLLKIAEKIDAKVLELDGKLAFPVNLSINEVAAHSTPAWNDETLAKGLLKVDVGVHVDGFVADGAFSVDLEGNDENKRLIEAAQEGLKAALSMVKEGAVLREVGSAVDKAIRQFEGFVPIHNLSGHQIRQYDLHAGLNIPNYDNGSEIEIGEGQYAIEPFATNGHGRVKDGKPSGIYKVEQITQPRDNFAREVLGFIVDEYQTLPFCARAIHKKFGVRGLLALKQMENAGILHQYNQLVETAKGKVAQAECTVVLNKGEVHVLNPIINTK